MYQLEGNSMDEIQKKIVEELLEKGDRVKPRNQWIHEIIGVSFRLNNPRARIIYNPARKYNLILGLGELFWYLRGSNRLDIIQYYCQRYFDFSDDGYLLYGAYGPRIFGKKLKNGLTQWEMAYQKLKKDPDTRQAIIAIYDAEDIAVRTRDVPCTCYIQFFIRDYKLNCIVNMRSNDIIWGTSYDVFSFTMLQEIMARQLKLELGWYMHCAGSMHIYDRHLEMAKEIINFSGFNRYSMPEMPSNPQESLKELLKIEEDLRLRGQTSRESLEPYWQNICDLLKKYSARKYMKNVNGNELSIPNYFDT